MFISFPSPYNIAFGLPVALVGLGFLFHCVSDVYYSIVSKKFNKDTCYFCGRKVEYE